MVLLFTITIFIGAALLFFVQPMVARMVLPLLGGAPAVWNTAMVFYQAALLAGYAYAHVTTRRWGVRRQATWHLALLALPLLVLPIAVPRGWVPPTQSTPIPWLLVLLTVAVGLPFFVVATTSPLLQRWFAATGHRHAADPYFLYAASNLGSLLALVSYPVLIEPRLGLAEQSRWWTAGFAVLAVLTAICSWSVRRTAASETLASPENVEPVAWRRRGRWLLLALVPCSLMLSVTTYMTTAIAPVPMLWVWPLGIYLLSFVLVFARRRLFSHKWMVRAMPLVVLAMPWTVAGLLRAQPMEPLDWYIALHLAMLFVVAMVCHGELANDRPPAPQLTEFYLWISIGGVLGGMFNALLAPWLFTTVFEYPLTLVLACALLPRRVPVEANRRGRIGDVAWPVLLGLGTVGLILFLSRRPLQSHWLDNALIFLVPPALCLVFFRRPQRLALGITAILIATTPTLWARYHIVRRARSFFGMHQVLVDPAGGYNFLLHGTTVHGAQSLDPARRREPTSYYTRTGPLGDLLEKVPAALKQRVAVIGLGAGTAACFGEHGQQWTFYEIDPAVVQIARDSRFFTFLADCPADVQVVPGDARLSLANAPDGHFGVMILNAYNSDTPPLHLLTREALMLYLQKLASDGVLAFHLSATHLDLKSVLANLAHDRGLAALFMIDFARMPGQASSRWMVMTRQPATVQKLATSGYWRPARPQERVGVWTDDFSSLFRAWSWD